MFALCYNTLSFQLQSFVLCSDRKWKNWNHNNPESFFLLLNSLFHFSQSNSMNFCPKCNNSQFNFECNAKMGIIYILYIFLTIQQWYQKPNLLITMCTNNKLVLKILFFKLKFNFILKCSTNLCLNLLNYSIIFLLNSAQSPYYNIQWQHKKYKWIF